MADLSHLGGLNPVELDLDGSYPGAKESTFRLPVKGRYTLQVPSSFPAAAFGRTKAGALSIAIDPTITGPHNDGFTLRYTKVSAKLFQRDGKFVSQAGDFLNACGFQGSIKDEQQLADAIEATAGSNFDAKLDWRAYSKSGFSLQGMERFPKLPDGTYQSWVEDPTLKDENGNAVRVRANLVIDRFIPAGE